MKILNKEAVKSLIKNYPNIKINNNMYLLFEKPRNYSKHIKDYFIEITSVVISFISSPFLIIYYSFKYIRTFLPMLIIKETTNKIEDKVYVPNKEKLFKKGKN